MAAVLVALLVAVFTVTGGGEIIRGKHYPIRSFPDKINGFSCPYHRPIAALEFGSVGGVKCLAENEILKHARLVDISERQWVHWAYKHDENYVFENFSWKKSTTPIQHDDSGYVLIEPHSGLLRMIKHHNHGLIFRTSGKDWRNENHTSRSTTPPASSPTWAPTTATPVSSSRSVTTSYSSSSSSSHQSSSRATSKQTTTDRLPTLFSTKKTRDPLLPTTSTSTTSTPKLSTTTSTLITVLVTTAVLGTCLGIITIFKKYINGQRQVMAAEEENNIFLNPLFSEETEV